MTGNKATPGIIPLAINDIFQSIENIPDREFLLRASYMEIYQENISDLITGLKISTLREDLSGSVCVPGLKETCVTNEKMLLNIMAEGDKNRKVAETNMNERSSRSHSIFRLIVESRNVNDKECDGIVTVSHLNLVDLAGSENATQTGATGERLKEGSSINKSLFMLGRVISQLSDGESYVNFRDSKLTRILQTSIGGNAKTAMICTITPANKEQSLSSVRFASRAKSIKNKPIVNEVMSEAAMLKRYAMEINKLKSALENERNTDKAQEVEQVKEKLDEQERQNLELQEKLKALKEKLVVSSLKKEQLSFKEKKTRRETWAAPAIKRFRRSEFNPSLSEFLKPFDWSSSSIKFSPVTEEDSADLTSPEDKLSPPNQNNSCTSIASFCSPTDSVFHIGELSKLEGMDSILLSPEQMPKRYRLRKRVNFSSSVLVWPNFKDAECQTDNSLLPKPLPIEHLTPRSNKSKEIISTPPGVTPRAVLRSRNKELQEDLDLNKDWLEILNSEIRELSDFQKNEIRLLNESYSKKELDGTADEKVKTLAGKVKSLEKSLKDSEQLILDVNKINSEQAREIKHLKERFELLTQERNKYFKYHEEYIVLSESNEILKKSLEEKERNLVSLQHDKQDFDIMMELALQKQKQVENDLRLCLDESWADIARLEGTSKVDVQKRLQEIHDIKRENSSLKLELNEYKGKEHLLNNKIKELESQAKKFENDLIIKSAQNEIHNSEVLNLQDRFMNCEGMRLKSEDSEDLNSPLWTTAREKSVLEMSRMNSSYAVNPSEISQKLSETISSLEEFGLSSLVRQLNYLPLDPFDTTVIEIFKEMLLKLHEYYTSFEQQCQSPHNIFPDTEKTVNDSLMLSNSSINHLIIQDYEVILTTWNLLNSICYDYYDNYLEKIKKDTVQIQSDIVIENAFKIGLTKLQESFNKSKDFMNHIDFESFIDEESSFINDHVLANKEGGPILSFADELKMLNDSNSEGDISCIPDADETIIEISKSMLCMEISQLQKNEEKYKAELLSLEQKVKLLESNILLLQTSNDKLIQLSQKPLHDVELIDENSTVAPDKNVFNSEAEKLREKCKELEERLVDLELVKRADSCPVMTYKETITLEDLKADCKFENEIIELKNAIASSQYDLSKLLPFKDKYNEQVVLNDKLRRELELAKCNCAKGTSAVSLNCSLSDIRDISNHTLTDCDNIALQCSSKSLCAAKTENIISSKNQEMENCAELKIPKFNHYASDIVSEDSIICSPNCVIAEGDNNKLTKSLLESYEEIADVKDSVASKFTDGAIDGKDLYVNSKYEEDILELKTHLAASREEVSELVSFRDKFNEQTRVINELRGELELAKCSYESSVPSTIIYSVKHDSPFTPKIKDECCTAEDKKLEFIMEEEQTILIPIEQLKECAEYDNVDMEIANKNQKMTSVDMSLLSQSKIKEDECKVCGLKVEHLYLEIQKYQAEILSLELMIKKLESNYLLQRRSQVSTSCRFEGEDQDKSIALLHETDEKSLLYRESGSVNPDKNDLDSEVVCLTEKCDMLGEQQSPELKNIDSSSSVMSKEETNELKDLEGSSKCEGESLEHMPNIALTVSSADVSNNKELELNLIEKQIELDKLKHQLGVYLDYNLKVVELEKIISEKNIEIEMLNKSLNSYLKNKENNFDELLLKQPSAANSNRVEGLDVYLDYNLKVVELEKIISEKNIEIEKLNKSLNSYLKNKENNFEELLLKQPSAANSKRVEGAECRNSPAYNLVDESELISLKAKVDMQCITIVELRKELEEYKDKEDELESMITDFTIKEAELEEKEECLKEIENKALEIMEENRISTFKLTAEIADKEKCIEELKEIVMSYQLNKQDVTSNNFNDNFKEAFKPDLKDVQNYQDIRVNKEVQTLNNEPSENIESLKVQRNNLNNDFEQLIQYLIDCNVLSAIDIEEHSFSNYDDIVKTSDIKHKKVIVKLQEYINHCQTELMETSKVENLVSEYKRQIFDLEYSVKELESHLDSKEKRIESLSSSIKDRDAKLEELKEFILAAAANANIDCDDNELVQIICNWKSQMESKLLQYELFKSEADDRERQLEDDATIKNLEIESLKKLLQKESSIAQSQNLIDTLKMKINDLECNSKEMELQLSSIYELQQDIEFKNKEIMKLQENCCNMESVLSLKKRENIQLKDNYEDQIKNLLNALKNEETRVSELNECLKKQEEKLNRTENLNEGTMSVTEALQNKIEELENTLQERCTLIDRLLGEKSEQECAFSNSKAEFLSLKTKYDEILLEMQNLARELSIGQEKIEELSNECNALKTAKDKMDSKTANIVESLDATQVELQNQKNLLSFKENKIKKLQNNLNVLDEEHIKCGLEIENLMNLIKNYKLDVAKKDLELDKLVTENNVVASELKINAEEIQKLSSELGHKLDIIASFEARETLYKKEIGVLSLSEEDCKKQLNEIEIKSKEIHCQNTILLDEIRTLQEANKDFFKVQNSLKEELQKEAEKNLDSAKILLEYEKVKLEKINTVAELEVLLVENEKNVRVIKNLELVIDKLQLFEQDLTDQIKDAENKENEYKSKNQSLLEKIQSLGQENEELIKLNDSIKEELYNLKQRNTDFIELNSENEKLKSDIEIIESKYQEVNSQNKKLKEEIQSLMLENKDLCKLNDSVNAELRKVNERNLFSEQLMSENEKLKLVIENIELDSETLTSENNRNIQTIKTLEIDVAKLQLSEKELLDRVKNVENSSDKFCKHNKTLQENIKVLQRENDELCKLNNSLKDELQMATQHKVDTVKLISENEKLKLLIEHDESELETLNFENKKNMQTIKDYEFENSKLNKMEQDLKVQLIEAENKINIFNIQNEKLLDDVQLLKKENKIPCKSCELLKGSEKIVDSGVFKLENEKLKLVIENIESESQKLSIENYQNKESIKNLKAEIQAANSCIDELRNQNKKLFEEVQSSLLENGKLCKQLEVTKAELKDKIEECKALDKELDETICESKNYESYVQGKCSELRNKVHKLEKENSQLNESLSSITTNASFIYPKRDCTTTLQSDMDLTTQNNSNADIICDELKNQVTEFEKENLSSKSKLSGNCNLSVAGTARGGAEMKIQYDLLLQKNKELTLLLETTRKELILKTEECKSLDKELDDTINDYKNEQAYITEITTCLRNQVKDLEKDKSRLSETLAWQSNNTLLNDSSQTKTNNSAPLTPHHELLVIEKQHLEREFTGLKKQNENLITEIDTLRNSNSAKMKEISELHSNITRLESEVRKLLEDLNKADFEELQKQYMSLQEKYAMFDGMEDCQLKDMHSHYVNGSTNLNSNDEKHDKAIKELKERYFEIERENNVLKMNLDALNAPALKEAKKLKEHLEGEMMKNKQLMRELRRLQNMKDTSICESSAPKKSERKTISKNSFDDDPASLSCGSQIVMDIQVMRLKNENYNLEQEKSSLQQENKVLNEHLEHYKLKGREWKTKCHKESLALKEKQLENNSLTKKLEAIYLQQSKFSSPVNAVTLENPISSEQAVNSSKQSLQPPLQQISTNNTSEKVCSPNSAEEEKPERKKVEKENYGRVAVATRMTNMANDEECKTQ